MLFLQLLELALILLYLRLNALKVVLADASGSSSTLAMAFADAVMIRCTGALLKVSGSVGLRSSGHAT